MRRQSGHPCSASLRLDFARARTLAQQRENQLVKLSDDDRKRMQLATREAAYHLANDIDSIRRILALAKPDAGDIRRMSGLLRRILVESEINKVAGPRQGRMEFDVPDLSLWYKSARITPWEFASLGMNIDVHGMSLDCILFGRPRANDNELPANHHGLNCRLNLEGFLNQKVLCFEDKWASRREIIKFAANKGHGVHGTSSMTEKVDLMLRKCRRMIVVDFSGDKPNTIFNLPDFTGQDVDFEDAYDRFDLVLLHLISIAILLTRSADVVALETKIASEEQR